MVSQGSGGRIQEQESDSEGIRDKGSGIISTMNVESCGLPGADLIAAGIADLEAGVESIPALLVSIGAPRLRSLGLTIPAPREQAEHRLYVYLAREDADGAHSRYNALIDVL